LPLGSLVYCFWSLAVWYSMAFAKSLLNCAIFLYFDSYQGFIGFLIGFLVSFLVGFNVGFYVGFYISFYVGFYISFYVCFYVGFYVIFLFGFFVSFFIAVLISLLVNTSSVAIICGGCSATISTVCDVLILAIFSVDDSFSFIFPV